MKKNTEPFLQKDIKETIQPKEEDCVWFELFPIKVGDKVRDLKTRKVGIVVGVTVPFDHKKGFNPTHYWYLMKKYSIALGVEELGEINVYSQEGNLVQRTRWEIEPYICKG